MAYYEDSAYEHTAGVGLACQKTRPVEVTTLGK